MMYLIIKKQVYDTLSPDFYVDKQCKNKELADALAENLNDEAKENRMDTSFQVVEIVN